ncbi:MAG: hypothetical protein ACI9WU_000466 [Myxococcota bacterium]|jgi:hypothetical protein
MKQLLIALSVLFFAQTASASDARFLLCFPGGPGSTADAQPVVDKFLGKLASLTGWSGATGTYMNDLADCARQFEAAPPTVVMVPLHVYLAKRTAWKLAAVSTMQNKETSGRYHIVAKKGATLESLKGQKLATGLKADARFFSRVAFANKVDVATHFEMSKTRSALRAVKNVAKGKVAAALVDDVQLSALDGLPMAKDLAPVLSGPALPGAIVAAVSGDQAKLAGALETLCSKDAALCKEMRITGFSRVDTNQLSELEKQLAP